MPAEFIKDHQSEIARVISSVVQETFKSYFDIDIHQNDLASSSLPDIEPISYEAIVKGEVMNGAIVVSIGRDTLLRLSRLVYPPEIAEDRASFEGCAEEIANIVGTRVKNFLNHYELNLNMAPPQIRKTSVGKNNYLHLSFQIDDQSMLIDFIIDENHPCHLDTKH